MRNKAIRILIAGESLSHSQKVEAVLNQMGYSAVAVVRTFYEVSLLTQHPVKSFDLLIINQGFVVPVDIDVFRFCSENKQVKYVLIYESQGMCVLGLRNYSHGSVQLYLPRLTDVEAMRLMMGIIDASAWVYAHV